MCSRSGVSPNLWMATSTQQVSKVYGKMIDQIQVVKPAPTQVRNAPVNIKGNQNESSRNNRTEGGGNSSNSGILGRIFGRAPSMSRNSTNRNKPKTPNRNKPGTPNVRMGNANNTQSVAGSIQGSVSINNNNNNVIQPPAKRVDVSRNKLIQNLKKKNLPNFVINGLVKSYDNKRKTANQVIREANNFGKTITMGKTAQRVETLRPRS